MTDQPDLQTLRDEIDAIDVKLLSLLSQRAQAVLRVADVKKQQSDGEVVYYRPEREAEVLQKLINSNNGPFRNHEIISIFRQIMAAALNLQKTSTVAYLGPEGSYSHIAVNRHFGLFAKRRPLPSFTHVFREVVGKNADYGMLPIENSKSGIVTSSIALLIQEPVFIVAETRIPIAHQLLSQAKQLSDITTIFAHPEAEKQCQRWLAAHCPNALVKHVSSNSQGVIDAKTHIGSAAIASSLCADLYQLPIKVEHISDDANNATRFVVIARTNSIDQFAHNMKIALLIATPLQRSALLAFCKQHHLTIHLLAQDPHDKTKYFIEVSGVSDKQQLNELITALDKHNMRAIYRGIYPDVANAPLADAL